MIQLDGNPCANQLIKTGEADKSKLCSTSHFGSFPAKKDVLQKEEFYYPMLLKVSRFSSSLVNYLTLACQIDFVYLFGKVSLIGRKVGYP